MNAQFHDRRDAGRRLAAELRPYADRSDVIVLALPRGGVPVGFEIADALHVPLEVFVVRKLGLPGQEELAMGALASGGVRVLDDALIRALHVSDDDVQRVTRWEQAELERREHQYRGSRNFPDLHGKTVILVDDGLATGATMQAAIRLAEDRDATAVTVAIPVAPPDAVALLKARADVVCLYTPPDFGAVGYFYDDFKAPTDDEIRALLS